MTRASWIRFACYCRAEALHCEFEGDPRGAQIFRDAEVATELRLRESTQVDGEAQVGHP